MTPSLWDAVDGRLLTTAPVFHALYDLPLAFSHHALRANRRARRLFSPGDRLAPNALSKRTDCLDGRSTVLSPCVMHVIQNAFVNERATDYWAGFTRRNTSHVYRAPCISAQLTIIPAQLKRDILEPLALDPLPLRPPQPNARHGPRSRVGVPHVRVHGRDGGEGLARE